VMLRFYFSAILWVLFVTPDGDSGASSGSIAPPPLMHQPVSDFRIGACGARRLGRPGSAPVTLRGSKVARYDDRGKTLPHD